MHSKYILKRYLSKILIISLIFIFGFIFLNKYEYNKYKMSENNKINSIVVKVKEKYPNITDKEILEIINSKETSNVVLKKYGIYIENNSIDINNENKFNRYIIINTVYIIFSIISIVIIILIYEKRRTKELNKIVECINRINKKDYKVEINDNSEDELSILKNEIYKTTIMLKESAENEYKDKRELKVALEDISHQLKTPLTSMLIMIDNLINEPDMNEEVQQEFLKDIKRNIFNISFLVQSLLKLSKFDSNTIIFNNKDNLVSDIIDESIKNVSSLLDLKNINISTIGNKNIIINCDYKWQIEAISNILKNCIEYSYNDSNIDIFYDTNKLYTSISIIDYGEKISNKDIKHIFERFYKGENSKGDSMGIGLALSKSIIEKNNGTINVESKDNTKFIIKYYK